MFRQNQTILIFKDNYFIVLLALIQLIFLLIQIINKNLYLVDSREYLSEAKNILERGTFYCGDIHNQINFDFYTKRPPIYPLFLAFIKLFLNSDMAIIIIQSIISIISIYTIRKAFLLIGYSKKYDFLLLILLILSPAQLIYSNLIMSEILFQLFISFAFYFMVKYFINNSLKNLTYYNISIVITTFIKPVMYLFVWPNLLLMIFLSIKKKSLKPILIGIVPIFLIQLYSLNNFQKTGYWQFSSIETINLVHYNLYYFNVKELGQENADSILDNQILQATLTSNYGQKNDYLKKSSKEILKQNFIKYSWFHVKGIIGFFVDPGRFDLNNFLGLEKNGNVGFLIHLNKNGVNGVLNYLMKQNIFLIILLIIIAFINIIKTLGLFIFSINKNIDIKIRLFTLLLVIYVAFATGPLGASRFSMPFIPIFCCALITVIPEITNNLPTLFLYNRKFYLNKA